MISVERTKQLRLELLKELDNCGNHACPEPALVNAMYALISPPPTKADVIGQLQWLESEGFATVVKSALGGSPQYMITTSGRAARHA